MNTTKVVERQRGNWLREFIVGKVTDIMRKGLSLWKSWNAARC
ncbi:MAG: hypothetical protein ACXVY9_07485 [Terriglobales bacterium]